MIYNIPELFQSEDIVYHYCDLKTAVEYILHNKQLRLSYRKMSLDPIENIEPWFSYSDISRQDSGTFTIEGGKSIKDLSLNKINNAKQLCLCKNDSDRISFNSQPKFPYEYYGFLKPRMWERYGNKYEGVCLAFSLDALKENASLFTGRDIEYLTYNSLERNHYGIDQYRIRELGIEEYWAQYSRRIEKIMFRKHLDYAGENEYRFLSFSEKEYDFINIENCLRGIIVSQTNASPSDFMKKTLNKYAEDYRVDLLNIKWHANGISFSTKKEEDALLLLIEKHLKGAN